MPDGNNFIVRRCYVDWRDFAFFMKTDWGDLIEADYNRIRLMQTMNQIFIISITVSALWQKNDMKF